MVLVQGPRPARGPLMNFTFGYTWRCSQTPSAVSSSSSRPRMRSVWWVAVREIALARSRTRSGRPRVGVTTSRSRIGIPPPHDHVDHVFVDLDHHPLIRFDPDAQKFRYGTRLERPAGLGHDDRAGH